MKGLSEISSSEKKLNLVLNCKIDKLLKLGQMSTFWLTIRANNGRLTGVGSRSTILSKKELLQMIPDILAHSELSFLKRIVIYYEDDTIRVIFATSDDNYKETDYTFLQQPML